MRHDLTAALLSCAEGPRYTSVRRFLKGLSRDELQFLAEFLGSSILEVNEYCPCSRAQLAERITEFQRMRCADAGSSPDQDHKMILLLEFLCRSGLQRVAVGMRASHA